MEATGLAELIPTPDGAGLLRIAIKYAARWARPIRGQHRPPAY